MGTDFVTKMINGQFTLIAEIGVNYYDIAEKLGIPVIAAAKLMIAEAQLSGVHVVKFQTYKADTLASKDSPSYWDTNEEPTQSQYALFQKYDSFGEDEYKELKVYCDEIGIGFFSTAFDENAADYLEPLMPVYKISSSDLNNLPFVTYQAKKNKPILLSVGASELSEIKQTVSAIRAVNNQPLVLLHCVLEYPTPYEHCNLERIRSLRAEFPDVILGYSDHARPDVCCDVIKTAYLYGATVIEKHFTLDKMLRGNDHYHAMDPEDAEQILAGISFLDTIRGNGALRVTAGEEQARLHARRSIVAAIRIEQGTVITEEMLTAKRPGTGIAPTEINHVIGKKAKETIEADTLLNVNMLV